MDQVQNAHLQRTEDDCGDCELSEASIICSRNRMHNSVSDGPSTSYRQQTVKVRADSEAFGNHEVFPWLFLTKHTFSRTGSQILDTEERILNVYGRHGKIVGKIQFLARRESATLIKLDVRLWINGNDGPLLSCSIARNILSRIGTIPRSPSLYHFACEELLLTNMALQRYNYHNERTMVHVKEERYAFKLKKLGTAEI